MCDPLVFKGIESARPSGKATKKTDTKKEDNHLDIRNHPDIKDNPSVDGFWTKDKGLDIRNHPDIKDNPSVDDFWSR